MLVHPQFDPIAIHLGPLAIRWYGLMYLIGFASFILLGRHRIKHSPQGVFTHAMLDDMLFYGVLGVILGGRRPRMIKGNLPKARRARSWMDERSSYARDPVLSRGLRCESSAGRR